MRCAAKVDANQAEIVAAARERGASVTHLHAVGKGVPDLLIGFKNSNLLWEIKDGSKVKSQRKLTLDQVKWHSAWQGNVTIIETVEQAMEALDNV